MALLLCVGLCPAWAFAEESVSGPCAHHRSHTQDCGYKEAEPGHKCTHAHAEDCYRTVEKKDGSTTEELDCHHKHDESCGYIPELEDGEGSPCTYECRICPVEKLIAALPDVADIRSDNAGEVRAQLEEILVLFAELTEDEQEKIDLSCCYALQEALDGANVPDPVKGEVSVDYQEAAWDGSSSKVTYATKTAENCAVVVDSTGAVEWTTGWYAVSGTVTIDQPITVNGGVHLILTDGCVLNAEQGIVVAGANSLTIYAQSENGGTLNATGTTDDSGNASAGIGGGTDTSSFDSGSITIHGGVINAAGGCVNMGNSGAGIGGSSSSNGNGGDNGAIEIYGGVITATSGYYTTNSGVYYSGAGIGGGFGNESGGTGSSITIYGGKVTANSQGYHNSGAGIGGGAANRTGGAGNSIAIYGGNITAISDAYDGIGGAGIGGGGGGERSGDGTNIIISGGTVTAIGGLCAAGIGGGGGESVFNVSIPGGVGTVEITGGVVDAKGGAANSNDDYAGDPIGNGGNTNAAAAVTKTTGIVFENGAGTVCGDVTFDGNYAVPAGYSLHIPAGASLSGSGTLTGGGTFTTENLTEDTIYVPDDLHFNGQDRTGEIAARAGALVCGRVFAVSGWMVAVTKTDDLTYTVTYTNDSDGTKSFTKIVKLRQPGSNQENQENQGQTGGSGGKNDGQSSGSGSVNSGSGNTVSQNPLTPPAGTGIDPGKEAAPEKPGAGIMPVNAGGGNTAERRTASDSAADSSEQGIKQPFIKGEDGKIGWDVIRAEEEKAKEGSTINVDMNGSTVVPRDIFDRIKGKNITITFDMGDGILWSVDGKSVTGDTPPGGAGDIDFSVKTGVNSVPVDIVNNVTGESYSIQISLVHEGEFGFTAVLSIDLGRENAGYTASLYYYNESEGELELICKDRIAEDGVASLAFTHASDYVIAIDAEQEEENGGVESAQSGTPGGDSTVEDGKTSQNGQPWGSWWIVVIGVSVIVAGAGVFFIVRKKKDEENE